MSTTSQPASSDGGWCTLVALVSQDGSAGHSAMRRLTTPRAPLRDLTDAVHCLCLLHGNQPGMLDLAAARAVHPDARRRLGDAAAAFVGERAWLARLVSVVGPLPSTPGQADTETAIAAQRHALAMLAQSSRIGCAAGASFALVSDWRAIRALLDRIGDRFGLEAPAPAFPDTADTRAAITAGATEATVERAMAFGAQQLLAQHRGLWDLLDARAAARDAQ